MRRPYGYAIERLTYDPPETREGRGHGRAGHTFHVEAEIRLSRVS
jgi:hypothetical protein